MYFSKHKHKNNKLERRYNNSVCIDKMYNKLMASYNEMPTGIRFYQILLMGRS